MTIVGCFAIDRAKQIELLNNLRRFEIEDVPYRAFQFFLVHFAGAKRVDTHAHRLGMPNSVCELDFASIRQPGGDHILGDPAPHVSRAAIDFARVFSRKRTATVPSHSAIAIADDFAASYTSIPFRTADHKPASGIDQVGRFSVEPFARHHFLNQQLNQCFANFFLFHICRVLSGNHHCGNPHRLISIVFYRDLRFAIRT